MAAKQKSSSSPLTFELGPELSAKLELFEQKFGYRSASAVIRYALETFSFAAYSGGNHQQRQFSVRLPQGLKQELVKQAKHKKVSVGELLRAALEALPATPPPQLTLDKLDSTMATKKVAPKKAAAKAEKPAAKKAVKAAPAPKKAAKKTAKMAVKKAAVKEAVKKAPAKKAPAKKKAK